MPFSNHITNISYMTIVHPKELDIKETFLMNKVGVITRHKNLHILVYCSPHQAMVL